MADDKGDSVNIYRRIFDIWESYTLKALDMMVWMPFLPGEQVGRFLEPISKLRTQYLEWMFRGLRPYQRRNMDELMERILTLESKVKRLEETVKGIRTSKRVSQKKKEEAIGEREES
jgi:hypothetical protein